MEHLHPTVPGILREMEEIHREYRDHRQRAGELQRLLERVGPVHELADKILNRPVNDFLDADALVGTLSKFLSFLRRAYTKTTVRKIMDILGPRLMPEERQYLEMLVDESTPTEMRKTLAAVKIAVETYRKNPVPFALPPLLSLVRSTSETLVYPVIILAGVRRKLEEAYARHERAKAASADRYLRRLWGVLRLHGLDVKLPSGERAFELVDAAPHRLLPDLIQYIRASGAGTVNLGVLEDIYAGLVRGAASKAAFLHPRIASIVRLDSLPPAERIRLVRTLSRLDKSLLDTALRILGKRALAIKDISWLLKNKERIVKTLKHVDPEVGPAFLELMERLDILSKLRERGLPQVDRSNVDTALRVLRDPLVRVILNNWDIWKAYAEDWEGLATAIEKLRNMREHNSRVPVYYEASVPSLEDLLGRVAKVALRIEQKADRYRIWVSPARIGEVRKIVQMLSKLGIRATVNEKGILTIFATDLPLSTSGTGEAAARGDKKRRGKPRRPISKSDIDKMYGDKARLNSILKSVAAAWKSGAIAVRVADEGIIIVVKKWTHHSKAVLSKEFYELLGSVLGISEAFVQRNGDKAVIIPWNAASALLRSPDKDFREYILGLLSKRNRRGKKHP